MSQHAPDHPRIALPRRRRFLVAAGSALAIAGGGFAAWLQGPPGTLSAPASLAAAREWLASLGVSGARSTRGWPLPQVLQHAAQSIAYSLDGYPQPKPAWFQRSVGALAFATFERIGAMRHDLAEAIPGAPPLDAIDLPAAARGLLAALDRFDAHRGAFAPHFAYGILDKPAYTRAHLMHLADHARWIEAPGPAGASRD